MNLQTFTLKNAQGLTVEILNFGGIVKRISAPDKNGAFANVVLGFPTSDEYLEHNPPYYGAIIGRFANRLGGARFKVDGETYHLAENDGANSLHGGLKGFDKVFWQSDLQGGSLTLTYISPDGEEGYPGRVETKVIYSLDDANSLKISYEATTDKTTPINLTNHCYFNLSGDPAQTIRDHELMIDASTYTVSDASSIPTGEIRKLESDLDFQSPRLVGSTIDRVQEGYNHNYIVNDPSKPDRERVVAKLKHAKSGRFLEMTTTEPGVQFYSGYFLEPRFAGLALEAQHYPDSPNRPEFPSTLLKPGETYRQTTTYRFGVEP